MSYDTPGAPSADSPNADPTEAELASTDANPAASSPADETDANQPVDLLSVVKSAVEEPEAGADPSAAEAEGEEAKPGQAEAEAQPTEGDADAEAKQAEADAKLPFHEHPRWKEVVAERNSFREDAGRFREIEGFMQEHGLQPDEVSEGFAVMASLKSGTPEGLAKAREYFASTLAALDARLGNVLPDDLQERVDGGEMTEQAAQELAQARAAEQLRKENDTARETASAEQRQREAVQASATAMANAVQDWEDRQKAADPDYAKKAALVETTCRAIVHRTGKPPTTPEEAVKLAEDALSEVNRTFKSLLPTPQPVRRQPHGSSAPTVAEPKTLREAIANAAAQAA